MYATAQTALDLDNKLFLRFEFIALDREAADLFSRAAVLLGLGVLLRLPL
jgi:hypothetical protein